MVDPRTWALALAAVDRQLTPEDLRPRNDAGDRHTLKVMSPSVYSRADLLGRADSMINGDAWDLKEAVLLAVHGVGAGLIDEPTAWALVMRAAVAAQARHTSWEDFGAGLEHVFTQITDGRAGMHGWAAVWSTLPWDTELEPLPVRQRFCAAIAGPVLTGAGLDARYLGGVKYHARGADEIEARFVTLLRDGYAITTRAQVIEYAKLRLHAGGERGLALAEVVAVVGHAYLAGLMTEDDAWNIALVTGKLAQQAYTQWSEFAASYERAWQAAGAPVEPTATHLRELERGLWAQLPWATDLDVTLFDAASNPRILRTSCSHCGAPRTRPSTTAFVYCDHCGALVDYDFARACEQPLARPGPVYEALCAELDGACTAALDAGDRMSFLALQLRIFDAWVEVCPLAVPIRVRDPDYRAAYVSQLATANLVCSFDPQARALEAALKAATTKLGFVEIDGRVRVLPEPYRAMAELAFQFSNRRDELLVEHGVYDLHPDGAPRDLQRRVGFAAFVQGWLPFLDEVDARSLVTRADLAREYVALPAPAQRAFACTTCGAGLQIVADAKRIVCDHCGRVVGVV
ncbi:MAG: DUF1266 domain-containing protein [Kofleriaceae bacterium]